MFALADRHRERGEASVLAHLLGDELVEGKTVAESRLTGMRRSGKKALAGVVIAVDAGVGESAESGELVAMLGEEIEVGARGLAGLREEKGRHHPQRHMDG
ncbi:MAG: hypothetical protein RI910_2433 [Verrucomicrobiota bacterium]